ncbi:7993_t:CDS:2 [Ambispora gerdemannii]|uniref:7993_t:CDS:1 n=1 Tax=Ambispora gerdemannii TaxID=144530 RepID=A0A9N9AX45_9GLOM|nr:7993_t:CDS:2 [Ambispora gerdemannii]
MSQISSESDNDLQIENSSLESTPFASPQLGNPEDYPLRQQLLKTFALYILKDSSPKLLSDSNLFPETQMNQPPYIPLFTRSKTDMATQTIKPASDSSPEDNPPTRLRQHQPRRTLHRKKTSISSLYNKISTDEAHNDGMSQAVIKSYFDFGEGLLLRYKYHRKTNRKRKSLILVNNELKSDRADFRCGPGAN